jgi:outer membrane protein assembly factor BamE (lipoprotein component of BamABCDE complex)
VLIGLIVTVSSCGIARQTESNATRDKLMHLQIGMERDDVLSLMGNPYTREGYGDKEYLFYETNHWANDERKRFTPILLQNGRVLGWGQKYYYDTNVRKK